MQKKFKAAIFGTGFMGRVHTEGLRRLGNVEVVAVAASTVEKAKTFAAAAGIDCYTGNYQDLLADRSIDVVHICTPNHLHLPMTRDALHAGKHVICEKPLSNTVAEAEEMVTLANKAGLLHCTFFNCRAYPQVRQMRSMVAAGDLGEIWAVQGTFSQDWLLYDTDWNWRIEIGASRAFADIGSHWCDLAEFASGLRFTEICADLHTFHKTRKKPTGQVETFAGKINAPGEDTPGEHTEVPIHTEDFASMMFRLGENARGAMTVSQISAGRKNRLLLELYGTKAGLTWNAEHPDELWIGHRNQPNRILIKDPSLMNPDAASFADLPGGHSEGYDDTFKQTFRRFYRVVADRGAAVEYPTFEDGLRQMKILEAVLESSKKRSWVPLRD